ncbi:dimethylargininase [Nocardioides jiangxiensis]|uniref:Arginine deiminase-related protein n=1 Tax=Nocardioides jiangxiensis TaxID=3064524 RepID=A0ABT9B1K1_9ACTN|nr:dimethylargininase [Nocardioides sp. WY-20]MDO7868730.1 arginine deiminase-related protein [Nocardioides sp. WY-20]
MVEMAPATPGRAGTPRSGSTRGEEIRTARARRYLMCRPEHFTVAYEINPWMDSSRAVDTDLALAQWEHLRRTYLDLGHVVDLVDPLPGLPDMVFAANGALVIDGHALGVRFRHAERAAEAGAYAAWLRAQGIEVTDAVALNEGEGDFLLAGDWLLAGSGFRSDPASHAEAQELFGVPVVSLVLVDPRFYHLDTALAVLDDRTVAWWPPAFSPGSRRVVERLFPDAIEATEEDALAFGLNAVSDGRHVVVAAAARHLVAELSSRGYVPVPVDLSELLRGGGGAKCCTLELRDAVAAA